MVWLSIATVFNYQIDVLNPDAETLVPEAPRTHIAL
jgi:hypothetical protein